MPVKTSGFGTRHSTFWWSGEGADFHEDGASLALRSQACRIEVAKVLGRKPDLPRRNGQDESETLRPRHVPLPVRCGASRRPPRRATSRPTSSAATSACAASTSASDGLGRLRAAGRAVCDARRVHPATRHGATSRPSAASSSSLGFSYDWSREITPPTPATCAGPSGSSASSTSAVSPIWPRSPSTGARRRHRAGQRRNKGRQVCERGYPVEPRADAAMDAEITAYADRLSTISTTSTGRKAIKAMQRDWVGRSRGRRRAFRLSGRRRRSTVLHHAARTLFGATYVVLAPEHPLVDKFTTPAQRAPCGPTSSAPTRRSERSAPRPTQRPAC